MSTKHLSSSHGGKSRSYSYALEIAARRAKSRKMQVVGFARFMMATVNHVAPLVKSWGASEVLGTETCERLQVNEL